MYGFGVLVWTLRVEQDCCGTIFTLCVFTEYHGQQASRPRGASGGRPAGHAATKTIICTHAIHLARGDIHRAVERKATSPGTSHLHVKLDRHFTCTAAGSTAATTATFDSYQYDTHHCSACQARRKTRARGQPRSLQLSAAQRLVGLCDTWHCDTWARLYVCVWPGTAARSSLQKCASSCTCFCMST